MTGIEGWLEWLENESMRTQDPSIERVGRRRLYYQIRPVVPVIQDGQVIRVRRAIKLGYCDEISLSEAKRRKAEIMAAINGGNIFVQAQLPLKALIERFRTAHMPALAATTQAKYDSHLRNYIEPGLGHLRLGEINRAVIAEWLLAQQHLSKATRLDLRNILASLFRCAIEWKLWAGENPAHRAPVGRGAPVREFRRLDREQIVRFLEEIRDTAILPARMARILAELCIISGLRVSEALGLQWRDIEPQQQAVYIRRRYARGTWDEPKTASSRRRRIIGRLADELLFLRPPCAADDDPIFQRPDGRMPDDRDLQQHVWRPAAERAGIYHAGFGLHSLRRLSVTWRHELGVPALEVIRQAGHSRIEATLRYVLEDQQREAAVVEEIRRRLRQ